MPLRILALVVLGCLAAVFCNALADKASAEHNVYLPNMPTPLVRGIQQGNEVLWCANQNALAYPNFIAQLQDVQDEYTRRVGITFRQVAYGTPATTGCMIQHDLVNPHACTGCSAWIYYASWPAKVEYKLAMGFTDWRTTQGHELGHGLLGLHEQYADRTQPFSCLPDRTWTVMSCGTGVRYPMALDVTRGCALIDPAGQTYAGCGAQEPAPDAARVAHSLHWAYVGWMEGRPVHPYDAPVLEYLAQSATCAGAQLSSWRVAHSLHYAYTAFNAGKAIHPFDAQTLACLLGR
jgi:hypothetical protein